jgi:hypothetical protein
MSAAGRGTTDLEPSPFVTCFAQGTKIMMADGTTKNIEDIEIFDEILSYDIEKGKFSSWRVFNVEYPNRPVYNINNGLLYVTEDHPMYIKKPDGNRGWGQLEIMPNHVRLRGVEIYEVSEGDQFFTKDGEWIEITSITYDETVVKCGNILSLTGKNTYFANGILVYEEFPYPRFMLRYYLYKLFDRIPFLDPFKDIFLF